MKISPIIILNIFSTIFLIIAIMAIVLMVKNGMNMYYISAAAMVTVLLFYTLYTINKGISTSNNTERIHKYKAKLLYHQGYFTVITYTQNLIINWRDIEAIFFINSPPLDGDITRWNIGFFKIKKLK